MYSIQSALFCFIDSCFVTILLLFNVHVSSSTNHIVSSLQEIFLLSVSENLQVSWT